MTDKWETLWRTKDDHFNRLASEDFVMRAVLKHVGFNIEGLATYNSLMGISIVKSNMRMAVYVR